MLESDLDVKQQAQGVLDLLVEKEVEEGVKTYISLLDQGLKAIFPEQDISQTAEITKVRGKVSVRLKTVVKGKDGIEVEGEGLRYLWWCCEYCSKSPFKSLSLIEKSLDLFLF